PEKILEPEVRERASPEEDLARDTGERRRAERGERQLDAGAPAQEVEAAAHPHAPAEAAAQLRRAVRGQGAPVASAEPGAEDVDRQPRLAQAGIEAAGGERRDGAGGVADQE